MKKLKVLVTGNLGFVGNETQRLLKKEGHEVIGYDIMEGKDIRDKNQFDEKIRWVWPDRILHLAAIARFAEADKELILTHETNVLGTKNVVEVASKYHIPLVYSSTGSAIMPLDKYEPPYAENIPACGNSTYGCSKALAERYVEKHSPHIILRYGHILGAEKRFHGLIGGFLSRIERGLAPTLYGGRQTNSFVYVKDIARANLLALTAKWDIWNNIFNIGSPEEISAEEAGRLTCEIFGYKGEVKKEAMRTVDPIRFCMDISKAEEMLGFRAKYSLREGLIDMKKELKYDIKKTS